MRKIAFLALLLSLILSSCGKKGPLTYPGEREQPIFDHVIDED